MRHGNLHRPAWMKPLRTEPTFMHKYGCRLQCTTFTALAYGAVYMDHGFTKIAGDLAELAFRAAMINMTISN